MNTTDSSISSVSSPGWQFLGETELLSAATTNTISTWLLEIIGPLNLQPDFVKQLLHSAQDVAMRALHSNNGMEFGHIHLCIFAPSDFNRNSSSWGFFRIEKIDSTELNQHHPDHAVEFYLYPEGQ